MNNFDYQTEFEKDEQMDKIGRSIFKTRKGLAICFSTNPISLMSLINPSPYPI